MNRRPNQSAHRQPVRANNSTHRTFSDLITNSENALARTVNSSQTQSQSQNTNQTNQSRTMSHTFDEDGFILEELMNQEGGSEAFISPEEGKVIQRILQIARKGKIKQENAFEIELKVIDPDRYNGTMNQFWKFASDLLRASLQIYDKRVDNVVIRTNKVSGGISQFNSSSGSIYEIPPEDESMEDREERVSKQRRENRNFMVRVSIQELNRTSQLDDLIYGEKTLEIPEKINIQKRERQFRSDPTFARKMKAFDNSHTKSLFLNMFGISENTFELKLFDQDSKVIQDPEQQPKKPDNNFMNFDLTKEWLSANLIAQTTSMFQDITKFSVKENLSSDSKIEIDLGVMQEILEIKRSNPQQPSQERDLLKQEEADNQEINIAQQDFSFGLPDQERPNVNSTLLEALSLNHEPRISQLNIFSENKSSFFPINQDSFWLGNTRELGMQQFDKDQLVNSLKTPWELEFKKNNLRKKVATRTRNENKARKQQKQWEIDFEDGQVENRSFFNAEKKLKPSQKKKFDSKAKWINLKKITLAPYDQIFHKAMGLNPLPMKSFNKNSDENFPMDNGIDYNLETQQTTNFYEVQSSVLSGQNKKMDNEPESHNDEREFDNFFNGINNFGATAKKGAYVNVRDVKGMIYQKLQKESSIRLSQLDWESNLSPQSMMIIFLNLAAEKDLTLKCFETLGVDDLQLSLGE